MSPTNEELIEKLNELINKHNSLAQAVINLSEALELLNDKLFSQMPSTSSKGGLDS